MNVIQIASFPTRLYIRFVLRDVIILDERCNLISLGIWSLSNSLLDVVQNFIQLAGQEGFIPYRPLFLLIIPTNKKRLAAMPVSDRSFPGYSRFPRTKFRCRNAARWNFTHFDS